jgi:hypothetical protein
MDMQILKGRNTIQKNGSVSGATGQTSRMIKRWRFDPQPNTTLARLEAAYMTALASVDSIAERKRSNAANGKFTPEGVKDDALSFALNGLIPNLHKARMTIKRAKAEVADRKSKLKLDAPNPTDIAAAFRRMEIRTFLRDMKSDEQAKYFATHSDNLPAEVAMAILELPPEYSGVTAPQHERLTQHVLALHHGPEIAETAELEEAIAAAESAVETGRDELRLEVGGIDKQKWDELAAPIEAKHVAPWLRRRKNSDGTDEINVVDLDRKIERPATPEEIASGIEYRDYDHYKEGKAA